MTTAQVWDLPSLKAFWESDGLANITAMSAEFPEGFDPRPELARYRPDSVTDLGCGYGRLCEAFDPATYVGMDLNPNAVVKACQLHPDYVFFGAIEDPQALPGGDMLLAYTVFLHMPDNVLAPWLDVIKARYERVLICEILGRDWRKLAGAVPVFNRDFRDYERMLAPFQVASRQRFTYARYAGWNLRDSRIHFLEFSKGE